MQYYDSSQSDKMPRILGLTASIINEKIKITNMMKHVRDIETTLYAFAETGAASLQHRVPPKEVVKKYIKTSCRMADIILAKMTSLLEKVRLEIMTRKKLNDSKILKVSEEIAAQTCEHKNNMANQANVQRHQRAMEVYESKIQCLYSQPMHLADIGKALRALINIVNELGILCFILAVRIIETRKGGAKDFIANFEDDKTCITFRNDFWDLISQLKQTAESYVMKIPKLPITDKVYRLLLTILESSVTCNVDEWKCIVFVRTRLISQTLAWLISILSKNDPSKYGFIKANHVCGQNTDIGSMTFKQQQSAIISFREHMSNLLIATSVIEEGFDVPSCNNVIHFDMPFTIASFIQAKGRARAQNSTYTMIVDEADSETYENTIKNFKKIEDFLLHKIDAANESDEEGVNEVCVTTAISSCRNQQQLLQIGRVRIMPSDAVSIIYAYCVNLSKSHIAWYPYVICRKIEGGYQCQLILPRHCGIHNIIVGDLARSKMLAKQSTFLEALRLLVANGSFDEFLVPTIVVMRRKNAEIRKKYVTECGLSYLSKNQFTSLFPAFLQITEDLAYIYKVSIGSHSTFGIIFFQPVPAQFSTKLYDFRNGVYFDVTCQCFKTAKLDAETISYIFNYHTKLYSLRLFHLNPIHVKSANCSTDVCSKWLLCPLKEGEIDIETISAVLESPTTEDLDIGSLVHRIYVDNQKELLIVKSIEPNFPIKRKMSHSSVTFEEHYQKRYNIKLLPNTTFALISKVRRASHLLFVNNTGTRPKSTNLATQINEYIPVHLLKKIADPVVFNVFDSADIAIAVAHRLSHYLITCKLVTHLYTTASNGNFEDECASSKIGQQLMSTNYAVDWFDLNTIECSEEHIPLTKLRFDNPDDHMAVPNNIPKLLALVKRACTCNSAIHIPYNLERLEVLGDSFLKFSATIHCFHSCDNESEGYLTEFRSQIICNRYLFAKAITLGLPQFLAISIPSLYQFDARADQCSWPGFFVLPESVGNFTITSKRIADCVESLIGAFLISEGYQSALQLMRKCFEINVSNANLTPRTSTMEMESLYIDASCFQRLLCQINIDTLEQKLGYTFKNRHYAVEAMTHSSAHFNMITGCYERLEFIGDAIVDFLITRHIYIQGEENIGPGKMSALRTAFVNNTIMSMICVKHQLYHHMLYVPVSIYKAVDKFVQFMERYVNQIDRWGEIMWTCPEPPKILADIFESVIGAIFLDSGFCLHTCWSVVLSLLGEVLPIFKKNIPLNPISVVHIKWNKAKFETAEVISDKTEKIYRVKLHVTPDQVVEANGSDPDRAKRLAAIKALDSIQV